MEGKIWGMTGSYTNVTICLPRYPGAPSKGLGWRQAALSREPAGLVLRGLERHGCPELLLWSPDSPGGGTHAASLPCALQLSGKSRTQREVGLWNSLGEGSIGRRKEREHGGGVGGAMVCLLSRCSIPFLL